MAPIKLVIGDKNLSSWSMRAWLALKQSGLPFSEIFVKLDEPGSKKLIRENSPSSRVPCLLFGNNKIWDSLAICEYLAELAPEKFLWPKDREHRAAARSYVAEMHSGFQSLRNQLSMDIQLKTEKNHLSEETIADITRIVQLWEQALTVHGGPFLFGNFGIVDAFYAPVVFRFVSYGIQIKSELCLNYMKQIQSHHIVREWVLAAQNEKPVTVSF